jgi:hypothetical protein
MTKPFTKAQTNNIAEKAAIIANTAFNLGRESERSKLIMYVKGQYCLDRQETSECDHDNCYLLADIVAYANQTGKHAKTEIGLGDATTN